MSGKPDFMDRKDDDEQEDEGVVGRPNFMGDKKKDEPEADARPNFMESKKAEAEEEEAEPAVGKPDYMEKQPGVLSASKPAQEEPAEELTIEYEVKAGDNLSYISRDHYGTTDHWKKIWEANKDVIKDPNVIRPGMVLKIPNLEE